MSFTLAENPCAPSINSEYSFNIAPQPAALIMMASKSSMGKAAMFFRAISFAVSRRPA